jgi:hypothetical protein
MVDPFCFDKLPSSRIARCPSVRRRTDGACRSLSTVKGAGKHGMAPVASQYNPPAVRSGAGAPPNELEPHEDGTAMDHYEDHAQSAVPSQAAAVPAPRVSPQLA